MKNLNSLPMGELIPAKPAVPKKRNPENLKIRDRIMKWNSSGSNNSTAHLFRNKQNPFETWQQMDVISKCWIHNSTRFAARPLLWLICDLKSQYIFCIFRYFVVWGTASFRYIHYKKRFEWPAIFLGKNKVTHTYIPLRVMDNGWYLFTLNVP